MELELSLISRYQYRGINKGLYVLLCRTQAEPGKTVKQEQEDISRNHVQTFIYLSVLGYKVKTRLWEIASLLLVA